MTNIAPAPPDAGPLDWIIPTWAMWTSRTLSRHPALVFAAGAFAAFVLKLLRVAHGDSSVALELLAVSDKSQVALGTATGAAAAALAVTAALAAIGTARAWRRAARALRGLQGRDFSLVPVADRRAALAATIRASALGAATLAASCLVLFVAPRGYVLVPVVLLVGWLVFLPFARLTRRADARAVGAATRHPVMAIVVAAVLTTAFGAFLTAYLMLIAVTDRMWLSPHLVTTTDGSSWVGYRLTGEEHRVYLVERDRSVRRVQGAEVRSESLCRLDALRDIRPLVGVHPRRNAGTPRCPTQ